MWRRGSPLSRQQGDIFQKGWFLQSTTWYWSVTPTRHREQRRVDAMGLLKSARLRQVGRSFKSQAHFLEQRRGLYITNLPVGSVSQRRLCTGNNTHPTTRGRLLKWYCVCKGSVLGCLVAVSGDTLTDHLTRQ